MFAVRGMQYPRLISWIWAPLLGEEDSIAPIRFFERHLVRNQLDGITF